MNAQQLTPTTLCFLLKKDEVLLAMKKRDFGKGKWNGVGGKVEKGETVAEAAIRETREEIGVTPLQVEQVATLFFYYPVNDKKLGKNVQTSVFFCTQWLGEIAESEEMQPCWFKKNTLPLESMWDDDTYWVPRVLKGEKLVGEFWFDEDYHLMNHVIKETTTF